MRPAALRAAKPDLELDIVCWAGGKHNPRARRMEQNKALCKRGLCIGLCLPGLDFFLQLILSSQTQRET